MVYRTQFFRVLPVIVGLAVVGCHLPGHSKDDNVKVGLIEVWTTEGWPPANTPIPSGFKVTPEEAYRIVAKSKRLSLKHKWICFRDDTNHYLADAFGKSKSARTALKCGVKVNGGTGTMD